MLIVVQTFIRWAVKIMVDWLYVSQRYLLQYIDIYLQIYAGAYPSCVVGTYTTY